MRGATTLAHQLHPYIPIITRKPLRSSNTQQKYGQPLYRSDYKFYSSPRTYPVQYRRMARHDPHLVIDGSTQNTTPRSQHHRSMSIKPQGYPIIRFIPKITRRNQRTSKNSKSSTPVQFRIGSILNKHSKRDISTSSPAQANVSINRGGAAQLCDSGSIIRLSKKADRIQLDIGANIGTMEIAGPDIT